MKILVTGFEPFAGEKVNPSCLILPMLRNHQDISTHLLPVTYDSAFPVLSEQIQAVRPDGVVMLGQASGRAKISLERVGLNWEDAEIPDEAGITRKGSAIDSEAPDALINHLPLNKWVHILKKSGHPVEVSFTAGAYVCNSIYFRTLQAIRKKSIAPTWALFVHVPFLPEQTMNKPQGTPSLKIEEMNQALQSLIGIINQERQLSSFPD